MAMERVVRSSIIAALLFLTLVALAAASSSGGDDAAAAVEKEQQCHPLADEPYTPQMGAPANTTAVADDEQGYMFFGMETGGGDKIRPVVVADQRYFFITSYAEQGFSNRPRWTFRHGGGDHRRLLPLGGGSGHAEVVASNVLRALMDAGSSCY